MNRRIVLAVLALGIAVALGVRIICSPDPRPGGISFDEAASWIEQLKQPAEVVFRSEVPATSAPHSPAEKLVRTHGKLTDRELANVLEDFRLQINSLVSQLEKKVSATDSGDLSSSLDSARLLWQKARLEAAVELARLHEYATVSCTGPRPPEAEGYERLVHGPAGQIGDQKVDMVIYISHEHALTRDAGEYYRIVFREYWRQYASVFNLKPLDERKRLIDLHDEAARERASPGESPKRLTPEQVDSAIITGPVQIDRKSYTLSLSG